MSNVAIVQEGSTQQEDSLSTLKLVTQPIPKASPGQVVVHITMRPILPMDFMFLSRSGYKGTPGGEGFGLVHEVGEGVTKFHKGQRVIPHTAIASLQGKGSWQKFIALAAELVWPVPDEMSDEQAAQFVVNPWTAYGMLKELQPTVPKGEYIIQTAALSAVGKYAILFANHWNLQLINIVRRPEQKAEVKALGSRHEVICSREEDVVARVREITGGRGAWVALDGVAGDGTRTLGASLRDGGRVVVYGNLGGFSATVDLVDLFRGVTVVGYVGWHIVEDFEKREAYAAEVAPLVINGNVAVGVEKFELSDFKRAMERAKQPGVSRKVLLVSA